MQGCREKMNYCWILSSYRDSDSKAVFLLTVWSIARSGFCCYSWYCDERNGLSPSRLSRSLLCAAGVSVAASDL